MSRKSRQNSAIGWFPPKGASAYFDASSDDAFKAKHPVGYVFLVLLGIAALMSPVVIYMVFVISLDDINAWMIMGWIGSFIIGIGLFNFVAIIIKQYLGHLVSILSFIIGGIMVALSLRLM